MRTFIVTLGMLTLLTACGTKGPLVYPPRPAETNTLPAAKPSSSSTQQDNSPQELTK